MHASRRDFLDFAAAGLDSHRLGESSPLARAAPIDQGLQRLSHLAAPLPSEAVVRQLGARLTGPTEATKRLIQEGATMFALDNNKLPQSELPGIRHTTLAGSEHGLRHLSVWRQTIGGGQATPPHRHDCEEVVVIESGRGELHIAGGVYPFGADTTLVIPPNLDHQIINVGVEPMKLTAAFSTSPVEVVLPDGQPLPLPWRS